MNLRLFTFACLFVLPFAARGAPPSAPQPLGCLIEPDQTAEIGSAVIGILDTIPVDRGDRVRRGQVVATLRDAVERAQIGVARSRLDIEADVAAAQAANDLAQDKLRRMEDLQRRNFVSSQAVFQANAEARIAAQKLLQAQGLLRVSKKELGLAEARLGERILRSPFDGVVTDRYLSVGERMELKGVLRIAKIDPLRVEVVLPHTLYGSIAIGAGAVIEPDLPGLGKVDAKITRIDKVLDATSNTFRVRLALPNPDYAIPANLRCKAHFAGPPTAGPGAAHP